MQMFFIDDSGQKCPTRPKMGEMVAVGGFTVGADSIKDLEQQIERICLSYGFPEGEMFKWSPGTALWMRKNLVAEKRLAFQTDILGALAKSGCRALFIAEDKKCEPAEHSDSHEIDLARLLIERVDWFLGKHRTSGLIIVDRHGGDMREEESFLADCCETLRLGTTYRLPSHILLPVLSSPSKLSRMLQAADLNGHSRDP